MKKSIALIVFTILIIVSSCCYPMGKADTRDTTTKVKRVSPVTESDSQYSEDKYADELYLIHVNKKAGYINIKGEIVVEPQFTQAREFSEGLAWVMNGTYVPGNGKPGHFDNMERGYLDKTGKFAIEMPTVGTGDFSCGLARAITSVDGVEKWGFIDTTGEWAIKPEFDRVDDFSEGRAAFLIGEWGRDGWGYIDTKGEIVVKQKYKYAFAFSDGMAKVKIEYAYGSLTGFIDLDGNEVIEPQFENPATDFSEGLSAVEVKRKWGYIDKTGKFVIEPQFMCVNGFSGGLAHVVSYDRGGGKFGYIDKTGTFVINPDYLSCMGFSEGLAFVHSYNKNGFINKAGEMVFEIEFGDMIGSFKNGMGHIRVNDSETGRWKKGCINRQGKIVFVSDY